MELETIAIAFTLSIDCQYDQEGIIGDWLDCDQLKDNCLTSLICSRLSMPTIFSKMERLANRNSTGFFFLFTVSCVLDAK